MAEGKMSLTVQIAAGGPNANELLSALNMPFNVDADHGAGGQTTCETTEETITVDAEIVNLGFVWLRNLDPTNYIEFGFATAVYYLKFFAGHAAFFPSVPGASTFYVKFNTSAGLFLYRFFER